MSPSSSRVSAIAPSNEVKTYQNFSDIHRIFNSAPQGHIFGLEPIQVKLNQETDADGSALGDEPRCRFWADDTYTLPGQWSDGTAGQQTLRVILTTPFSKEWKLEPGSKAYASVRASNANESVSVLNGLTVQGSGTALDAMGSKLRATQTPESSIWPEKSEGYGEERYHQSQLCS